MKTNTKSFLQQFSLALVASVFVLMLTAPQVAAAPIFLNPGDPCGFDTNCTYLGTDFNSNDDVASVEAFLGLTGLSSIDKSDTPGQTNFLFNGSPADPNGLFTGSWEYIGPLVDPVVYMTIKSGNQYAAYQYIPSRSSGLWSTENLGVGGPNNDQNIPGLSHLNFFAVGTPTTEVPEPASLLLLSGGLIGFALKRRRED